MRLYLTALNPTASVTDGLLPAAARLGMETVLLTDQPDEHRAAYAGHPTPPVAVVRTQVRDAGAVAARVRALATRYGEPAALLSNSDHLQAATALAAQLLSLPGKDWQAAARCKNKFLTRAAVAAAGLDVVATVEIGPDDDVGAIAGVLPFPAVVKPCEGVASEDVLLVENPAELATRVAQIRARRGPVSLVAEEYLAGKLCTYDTLGDGTTLHHFGSWRTSVGTPPSFIETGMRWAPEVPEGTRRHLVAQLAALGVGFAACHTEFVIADGRARLIEVNYRLVGDTVDLICAELLGVDLFAEVIRVHRGERLSPGLPAAGEVRRHARIDWITADRSGTLTVSPPPGTRELTGGIRLGHRRLRQVGDTAPLHGTNRDYLSVVHAIGPTEDAVDAAVDRFVGEHAWVIG